MNITRVAMTDMDRGLAIRDTIEPHRRKVISTGLVDCGVVDWAQAELGLDAFAQWFHTLRYCEPDERLVMLKGPIDQIWHALILHT